METSNADFPNSRSSCTKAECDPPMIFDPSSFNLVRTCICVCDIHGVVAYSNAAAQMLCADAVRPGAVLGFFDTDGSPLEDTPIAQAIRLGGCGSQFEFALGTQQGGAVRVTAYIDVLDEASQASACVLLNFYKSPSDKTDLAQSSVTRKRDDEHQRLLVNELNHRVKNTLATVLAVAAQSFRTPANNEIYPWFEGRLIALSRAHDVLARESWEAADLHEIVTQATAPLLIRARHRFEIEGPKVHVQPKMALSLTMALHELCTNAAKYGALSSDTGSVSIRWWMAGAHGGRQLHLRWVERGGPPVVTPRRRGFGSRLIERGLARELGGDVRLLYETDGVVCEITAPF